MPGYIWRSLVLCTPSKSYPPHSRPKLGCPIRSRRTQRNPLSLFPTDFVSSVSQTTNSRIAGDRVRIFTKCLSRVIPTTASDCVFLSTSPRRASTLFHLLLRRVLFSLLLRRALPLLSRLRCVLRVLFGRSLLYGTATTPSRPLLAA